MYIFERIILSCQASIGGLVGPFIGGVLYDTCNFSVPFAFSVAILAVDAAYRLLSFYCFRPKANTLFVANVQSSEKAAVSQQPPPVNTRQTMCFLFNGTNLIINSTSLANGLVMLSLDPVLPLFLGDSLGASAVITGLVFLTSSLGATVGSIASGKLLESQRCFRCAGRFVYLHFLLQILFIQLSY